MYKAVNSQTGQEIIILNPRWAAAIDSLRLLDQQDILVCQGCKQPLRVRAGEVRRWHFAHKHVSDCEYGYESPDLLNARAALYEWLVSKFGEAVTVEKKTNDGRFQRPIDCWVENGDTKIGYWIFDVHVKPQIRDDIQDAFKASSTAVNWVFTLQMLHESDSKQDEIILTTTEREFMQHTEYDEIVSGWHAEGRSLHYLNGDTGLLTTFRGLHRIHAPSLYKGHKENHNLSDVQVLPGTGGFVHPGEFNHLLSFRQMQSEKVRNKTIRVISDATIESGSSLLKNISDQGWGIDRGVVENQASSDEPKEVVCEFCGRKTSDWWAYNGKTGLCKCRDCLRQGKA